jgi:DNA-binding MarR family transcriptional regulator
MRTARVLTGISAQAMAAADEVVTMPQLRVLVLAATHGPLNSSAVASSLQVHPSNASRVCERLVQADLLNRRDSPTDRRQVELTLTPAGDRLISSMFAHRRAAFSEILRRMPASDRAALTTGLESFADAAGEPVDVPIDILTSGAV